MPSGKVESYRIVLKLDRQQRKLLDRLEQACNFALSSALRTALAALETTKLPTPLSEFERLVSDFLKDANPPFFDETKKAVAKRTSEVYASIVAGDISDRKRGRGRALLVVCPAHEVVFSSSGKQVRVPYLGVVNYTGNQKAVPSGEAGVYIPAKAHMVTLGWHNNEPCLMLDVVAPKRFEASDFGNQKLVKLTASEITRRKKVPGTDVPPNPEQK